MEEMTFVLEGYIGVQQKKKREYDILDSKNSMCKGMELQNSIMCLE